MINSHDGNAATAVDAIRRIRCGDIDPRVDAGVTVILTDLQGICWARRVTASDGCETMECHLDRGLVMRAGKFRTPCLARVTGSVLPLNGEHAIFFEIVQFWDISEEGGNTSRGMAAEDGPLRGMRTLAGRSLQMRNWPMG